MARATLEIIGLFSGITTACSKCGRQHITVFKLRHISDDIFRRVGEFYKYDDHDDPVRNERCSNSGKSPNWGGPAKPPR